MEEPRRVAGQHARGTAKDLATRMLVLCAVGVALLALAWFWLGLRSWALVGVEAVVIGAMALADRRVEPIFSRWLQGAVGEEEVGALLEKLREEGWQAIHDVVVGERGNVDHILVGPGGIFTIETKSHRGRIAVEAVDEWMLKQAYAERKLIEKITGMRVEALLVFSQAYLVGHVPARRRGVTILPARMLEGFLARRPDSISIERAAEVAERIAVAVGQGATGNANSVPSPKRV
jgi:hypothetical protein